jgi:precorrin-3B C17-methyltransferase
MTGTLHIVGLGPGGAEHRTPAAAAAVRAAEVVVGYGPYVDQCADLLDGQEVVRGRMGEEAARADEALARAAAGARVALVSSGDAGVYGMAARTLARAAATPDPPEVAVVPGVTAALAAGALLGAPLADDWASLSLSDLNVPWARVEARLAAVAAAGLALALYNPRSPRRTWQLDRVLEVLRGVRPEDTPVGLVSDAGRRGERVERTTLAALDPARVSMHTVIIVAGESGAVEGPWIVARRGRVSSPSAADRAPVAAADPAPAAAADPAPAAAADPAPVAAVDPAQVAAAAQGGLG